MAPLLRRPEADEVTFRSPQSRRPSAESLASRGDKAARREGRETKGERQQAPDPEQTGGVVDMPTVKKSIEVDVPVRVGYDQWTQFEEFPRFREISVASRSSSRSDAHRSGHGVARSMVTA